MLLKSFFRIIIMWAILGASLVIFAGGAFGLVYNLVQSAIVLFSSNNSPSLLEGLVLFPIMGIEFGIVGIIWGVGSVSSWILPGALVGIIAILVRLYWINSKYKFAALLSLCFIVPASLALLVINFVTRDFAGEETIRRQYVTLYESYNRQEYDTAYNLMCPDYRGKFSKAEFVEEYVFLQKNYKRDYDIWPVNMELQKGHRLTIKDDTGYLFPQMQWSIDTVYDGLHGPELKLKKDAAEGWCFIDYEWIHE